MICVFYNTLSYHLSSEEYDYKDSLFSLDSEGGVNVALLKWITVEELKESIASFLAYVSSAAIKITGYLIVAEDDDGLLRYSKYNFTKRGMYIDDDCEVKVSIIKPAGDKAPALTLEEKMELVAMYWNENKKMPEQKEVYKEFKIGAFIAKTVKDAHALSMLREIVGDAI